MNFPFSHSPPSRGSLSSSLEPGPYKRQRSGSVSGRLRSACAHVGMKPALQGEAMSVLAGVMHVGNVEFSQASGEEYAAIQNEAKMHLASKLMGCEDMAPLLLLRTMKVPGAVYNIQLTPPQAC